MFTGEKRDNLVVSTDIGGLFRPPDFTHSLYTAAGFQNFSLEIVPFYCAQPALREVARLQPQPYDVGGIHGQLGVVDHPHDHPKGMFDWLKIKIADTLIPALKMPFHLQADIIGCLHHPIYFNVHNELIDKEAAEYADFFAFAAYCYLAIENGAGKNPIQIVRDQIRSLQDQGVTAATGTYDLAHAVLSIGEQDLSMSSVSRCWNQVLKNLSDEFGQLHLPIGLDARDSLPIHEMIMEKTMLHDLAEIVNQKGKRIIFENQDGPLGTSNIHQETARLRYIGENFVAFGLIQETYFR